MKAIVTGSRGLIGSEGVRVLAGEGWDVAGEYGPSRILSAIVDRSQLATVS